MIEDALGRMIDTGNATLADLKSMISSMMSSKVAAQPLPKGSEGKAPDAAKTKEIFDLMTKLNQNISEQFTQSKAYLDKIVDAVKQSATKATGADSTKGMGLVNESLKKVNDTLGGLPKSFDSLGANIANAVSNSLSAVQSSGAPNMKNLENLVGSLNMAIKNLNKINSKSGVPDFTKKGMDDIGNLNKLSKSESVLRKKSADKYDKLAEAGLKKGSIHTFDDKSFQVLLDILKLTAKSSRTAAEQMELDKKIAELNTNIAKGQGYRKEQGGSAGTSYTEAEAAKVRKYMNMAGMAREFAEYFSHAMAAPKVQETVFGGASNIKFDLSGGKGVKDFLMQLVGGLAKNVAEVAHQEREVAIQQKKIAFQTEGLTAENAKLQEQYLNMEQTTYRTGVERNKFNQILLQHQGKGIRNQQVLKELTVAQLSAEKQIGLEAGALGDDFVKLHREAGFTNIQINHVAANMREVARDTGLTGQELKSAMDSSKGIVENMKNAATLTADSIRNITTIMAEAQKLGVTQQVGNLLEAASSSSKLFLSSSSETKTLLFQAAGSVGKIADLQNGILMQTKEGQKALGQGLDNVLKRFGVQSIEEVDKLSDEAKTRLNLQLQATYKMDLGEFTRVAKAVKEGALGYADRLQKINTELAENVLTEEERLALETKRTNLQRTANMGFLVKLDETTKKLGKDGKDINKVFAEFGKELNLSKNKELQARIQDVAREKKLIGENQSIDLLTTQQKTQLALEDTINSMNEGLKKVGGEGIIDPAKIEEALKNPEAMRQLTADIQKGQQELATKEAAAADPALQMQQKLLEANDYIGQQANKMSNILVEHTGLLGQILTAILSTAATSGLMDVAGDLLSRKKKGGRVKSSRALKMPPAAKGKIGLLGRASSAIKAGASKAAGLVSTGVSKAAGAAKSVLGAGKSVLGKGAQLAGGLMKGLPVVGALLGGGVEFATRKAEGQSTSKALAGTAGGMAGGAGGALAGAAAGAALGSVVPIVGTAVGGILGGIIGGFGGGWFGGKIADVTHDKLVGPVKKEIEKGNTAKVAQDNLVKPVTDSLKSVEANAAAVQDKMKSLEEANKEAVKGHEESLKNSLPTIPSESMMPRPSIITPSEIMAEQKSPLSPSRSYPALTRPNQFGISSPTISAPSAYPPLARPNQYGVSPSGASPYATSISATSSPMVSPVPSTASPMMPQAQNLQAAKVATAATATGDVNQGVLKNIDKTSQREIDLIEQQLNVLIKIQQGLDIKGGQVAPDTTQRGGTTSRTGYNRLPTGNFNESSIREVTNL